jgi:hypothetical protein
MQTWPTLALAAALASATLAAPNCEALAKLALHDATFTAESVPAGSFTPPGAPAVKDLPAFCRVAGSLKPSKDSDIQFEIWLPASDWNGKFQGIGNGGFAGSIGYGLLGDALRSHYATASTDTGHTGAATDGAWALGHYEKIVDFGYRAIHETAAAAKTVIRAYYGEAPKHSYFSACSNGGRQALIEAQRYPEDYDGLIAGAPAADFTHLAAEFITNVQALGDAASYIPGNKLPAIEAAALAACDALDGVQDGVISDPPRCKFDPGVLLCSGEESAKCLTAPQVDALRKIYAGLRKGKGQMYPGFPPGGETGMGGWGLWVTGGSQGSSWQFAFGTQFYKNLVYNNADWDFKTFNLDRDLSAANDKVARILNALDPDLKRFQARGGKLILYHGWSDAAIPALATVDYYKSVTAKMGDTNPFLRLYLAPGMQHCGGGPGPDSFGQGTVPHGDPQHDLGAALERWVEQGVAPDQIIASKLKSGTAVRTRPLCPYPQVARWSGSGSTDDAASFTCAAPK